MAGSSFGGGVRRRGLNMLVEADRCRVRMYADKRWPTLSPEPLGVGKEKEIEEVGLDARMGSESVTVMSIY